MGIDLKFILPDGAGQYRVIVKSDRDTRTETARRAMEVFKEKLTLPEIRARLAQYDGQERYRVYFQYLAPIDDDEDGCRGRRRDRQLSAPKVGAPAGRSDADQSNARENRMGPGVEIRRFAADQAGQSELDQYYALRLASNSDLSSELPPSYDAAIGWLRNAGAGRGSVAQWAAYLDGRLVGLENVVLLGHENDQLGLVWMTVHPDHRRCGIGTEMLRNSVPVLRDLGRTQIEGWNVQQGGPGEAWATRLGFESADVTLTQGLSLDAADPRLWDVPAPAGYHAVSWTSIAPDELVASYASARNAMHDAPVGDIVYQLPRWTVQRVRQGEHDTQVDGIEQRVVVAVHEPDGEVAGFTEVELRPNRKDRAVQGETAVLARHRGHGLGRYLKAQMAAWLRSDRPELRRVLTNTAASNTHMIRVNHQIGYTTSRTTLVLSSSLSALGARLGV